MRRIVKMVLAVSAIGLAVASCKKDAQAPIQGDNASFNTSMNVSDLENLEFCTELYPNGEAPRAAAIKSKKWKNGSTITVKFLGGDSLVRSKVVKYAKYWSDYANITFKFVDTGAAKIRISFKKGGSSSYIGTDAVGIPANANTMNYGWFTDKTAENEFSRVIIHEFGHALGLIHEHQNPLADIPWDKDKVYAYYKTTNDWDTATVDINIFKRYDKKIMQYSEYDSKSIMHYSIPKQLVTDSTYAVGWNRNLSETDKTLIAEAYPKEETMASTY